MIGRKRSSWTAMAAFALIAGAVLGGMAWVTSLQLHLVNRDAEQRQRARLREAMVPLEKQIEDLLNPEIARDPTDYLAYHIEEAETGWTHDNRRIDVEKVLTQSPIATSGPLYDWIDLYFHVSEDAALAENELSWRSPQLSGEADSPRAFRTMDWLKSTVSVAGLAERVSELRAKNAEEYARLSASRGGTVQVADSIRLKRRMDNSYAAQMRILPPPKCIHEDPIHQEREIVCSPPMNFGLTADPMTAFWLDGERLGLKLIFVRTGYADVARFYQGFVVDWQRLKPELQLVFADGVFSEVELIPLHDAGLSRKAGIAAFDPDRELGTIPLFVAGELIDDPETDRARSSVIKVLIAAWVVAVAVLGIAGLAVRNLVLLTERRLQFAYAVTHELRTPLTTFRLYADMFSAGLVPEESKQEYLDSLNRESIRLSNIVQGVLEYSRLENQKIKLNPIRTSASELLQRLESSFESLCERYGVRAETQTDLAESDALHVDVELVGQIAGVLVDNAVRHARESQDPSVRIQLSGSNGSVQLHVADSGSGVERSDAHVIFRPFRRGRSAETNAQRGIGLGLALARSWAGLLGGKLELVERHDASMGGAHFCLTIPRQCTD